jgi:hypothetical protein
MVRRKRRRRDGCGPPVQGLGLSRTSGPFGDDGEIVQRVGQIRMMRPKLFFLKLRGTRQQLISRGKVASRRGALRPIEHVTRVLMFRHGMSGVSFVVRGEHL